MANIRACLRLHVFHAEHPRVKQRADHNRAPHAGDQTTAEQKIIDGYAKKQINCTPNLPPNPQSVTWDPPGFAPFVGGTGVVHDANPQLGGQYRDDYVDGRWHIEYPYC
jgi:hypothetical protein